MVISSNKINEARLIKPIVYILLWISMLPFALAIDSSILYPSIENHLFSSSNYLSNTLAQRLFKLPETNAERDPAIWGHAYQLHSEYFQQNILMQLRQRGMLIGMDSVDENDWRTGMVVGRGASALHKPDQLQGNLISYPVGLYMGILFNENWNIRLGGAYQWHQIRTERVTQSGPNNAHYQSRTIQFFSELAYRLRFPLLEMEPFAKLDYIKIRHTNFKEQGFSPATLASKNSSNNLSFSTLGVRTSKAFNLKEMDLILQASVGWRYQLRQPDRSTIFVPADKATRYIKDLSLPKKATLFAFVANIETSKNFNVALNYSNIVGKGLREHSTSANMIWKF